MEALLHFAGNFWWLIFPLGGVIGGGVRAVAAANERRAQRRLERYRIKQQTKVALAEASGRARTNEAANRREMTKVLQRHADTDARWLDYEIDVAKLLDFPLMTDMRSPLTVAFHKARSHADLLRPATVDDILDDRGAQIDYRDAVHEYVAAFDVAEAEAVRRRRSDFSADAQERLEAQRICCGSRPTAQRRPTNAGPPTPGPRRSSTAWSCCLPGRGPASSERSQARSRPDGISRRVRTPRCRAAWPAR